ncbi:MAG TPA: saccharopine dehydrogenase C-terminal domain-containing protein [Thermoanaerobaculia bacterium]|jgi:lysine 6-dehydrogenase
MKKIAVLGAGLVGSLIVRDLAQEGRYGVLAVDRDERAMEPLSSLPGVQTEVADLSSPAEISRVVAGVDAVVGAVPGFLGMAMLRTVLECRKPVADISFSPEDPFLLDAYAKKKGIPAIVDCGVSPGLSNVAAGRSIFLFDRTDSVRILVGGLPFQRTWPYEYRIVFSATDVIEEYTRPARVLRGGRIHVLPALSEPEPIEVPGVGTLEAFLTDGLRTVLTTIPARDLEEKTLRYPGHAEKMRMLRETGFFLREPIDVGGVKVSPRDVTERLLFEAWRRRPAEEEFVFLRVVCEGASGDKRQRLTVELFDRTNPATGDTAMARTTGFPCAIAVRMLVEGTFREPGIHPPEFLGRDPKIYEALRGELERRGVGMTERVEEIPTA